MFHISSPKVTERSLSPKDRSAYMICTSVCFFFGVVTGHTGLHVYRLSLVVSFIGNNDPLSLLFHVLGQAMTLQHNSPPLSLSHSLTVESLPTEAILSNLKKTVHSWIDRSSQLVHTYRLCSLEPISTERNRHPCTLSVCPLYSLTNFFSCLRSHSCRDGLKRDARVLG